MPGCPSDLRLECYLGGIASRSVSSHVRRCDSCRWRVAGMRRDGVRFLRDVYPATRAGVFARAGIARWYRSRGPR